MVGPGGVLQRGVGGWHPARPGGAHLAHHHGRQCTGMFRPCNGLISPGPCSKVMPRSLLLDFCSTRPAIATLESGGTAREMGMEPSTMPGGAVQPDIFIYIFLIVTTMSI